jgi:hypothetical protein
VPLVKGSSAWCHYDHYKNSQKVALQVHAQQLSLQHSLCTAGQPQTPKPQLQNSYTNPKPLNRTFSGKSPSSS